MLVTPKPNTVTFGNNMLFQPYYQNGGTHEGIVAAANKLDEKLTSGRTNRNKSVLYALVADKLFSHSGNNNRAMSIADFSRWARVTTDALRGYLKDIKDNLPKVSQ